MLAAAGIIVAAILLASVYCWTAAGLRLAAGRPLVPWSPRRSVPWALFDLCAVIVIQLVAGAVVHQLGLLPDDLAQVATLAEQKLRSIGFIVASLATVAIALPLVSLRTGATLADFGWSGRHAAADIRVGLAGFVMLGPPVYALQVLLVLFWKKSQHPLIEGLLRTPDLVLYALAIASAVAAAPLVEELLFRVFLQGFLEKVFTFRGAAHELFLGTLSSSGEQPPLRGWSAWLPIGISSVIFALLHWSHGPDWVPLTVLALGLGYLYQRTHRLLPILVVHMLLNGFSLAALGLAIYLGVELPGT